MKQVIDAIGMKFDLGKYAVLTIKRGVPETSSILSKIPRLDEEKGYQNFGICEGVDFLTKEVKNNTKKEYLHQIHSILNIDLLGHYTMTAICAYAVPVM
eukprot:3083495-Ditylum_brightwellii.AAC.1